MDNGAADGIDWGSGDADVAIEVVDDSTGQVHTSGGLFHLINDFCLTIDFCRIILHIFDPVLVHYISDMALYSVLFRSHEQVQNVGENKGIFVLGEN